LQATVAVSTAEAEYMAASAGVKEALWLFKLFSSFGIPVAPLHIMFAKFQPCRIALGLV